jgi:hypothetical protein
MEDFQILDVFFSCSFCDIKVVTHLKLLDGFNYKSKGENNRRKKS